MTSQFELTADSGGGRGAGVVGGRVRIVDTNTLCSEDIMLLSQGLSQVATATDAALCRDAEMSDCSSNMTATLRWGCSGKLDRKGKVQPMRKL